MSSLPFLILLFGLKKRRKNTCTVKILKIGTFKVIPVSAKKTEQFLFFFHGVMGLNDSNGMANSSVV